MTDDGMFKTFKELYRAGDALKSKSMDSGLKMADVRSFMLKMSEDIKTIADGLGDDAQSNEKNVGQPCDRSGGDGD